MTNRAEYETTPVANALRTAKRALADALNAGAFEVQWAAAISDQAARAVAATKRHGRLVASGYFGITRRDATGTAPERARKYATDRT